MKFAKQTIVRIIRAFDQYCDGLLMSQDSSKPTVESKHDLFKEKGGRKEADGKSSTNDQVIDCLRDADRASVSSTEGVQSHQADKNRVLYVIFTIRDRRANGG
ncbi:hypothetical protein TNIN_500561 [Trichonephila inaurata madagascariensis]|uniref:Uncharacterized protein n=1 Tax=Trichonephila inaurata madagascariensis TaxID=2747483 RepID=A0A8X6MJ68_9ARAC|nr:hypothetical protein TNIN_500561 [Trichonephila inaurata madagascariensis]